LIVPLSSVLCAVPEPSLRVVASPEQLHVREGMEATFHCSVDGDARTRLVWSRLRQVNICFLVFSTRKRLPGFVL